MKFTLTVEGHAYKKGNTSSLWITPGIHDASYFVPQTIEGSVRILGPCEHAVILETKNRLADFFIKQGCTVQTLETVDD